MTTFINICIYIYIYLHNICIYEIHKHDIHNKNIYGGGRSRTAKNVIKGGLIKSSWGYA